MSDPMESFQAVADGDRDDNDGAAHDDDDDGADGGHVYRGLAAELALVRAAAAGGSDDDTLRTALQEYMDASRQEVALHAPLDVLLSLQVSPPDPDDNAAAAAAREPGTLLATSERVMFWCRDAAQGAALDLAVDAACLELHALQEEPERAVYVQVRIPGPDRSPAAGAGGEGSSDDDEADDEDGQEGFLELTIVPCEDTEGACQLLFDALSKLISLHPIDPHDDDHNFFGADDGDDDAMFHVAAPEAADHTGKATAEEREQMLQRLDDLLVVPPELERVSDEEPQAEPGQFDDAEDDDLL